MGLMHVSQLKPGMVLASRIRNRTNTLSLDAGTELTAARIKALAENGVMHADIAGHGAGVDSAREYFLAAHDNPGITLEEKIHSLFVRTQMDHPFVRELMRNSARRLHAKYPTKAQA